VCRIIPNRLRDHEVGVEDLVPAVLGVGLGEHRQLDVGGVAAEAGERLHQVVDLVLGQRKPPGRVGLDQGLAAPAEHVDVFHRLGVPLGEQDVEALAGRQHRLGHPVVQQRGAGVPLLGAQATRPVQLQGVGDDPLDPVHVQPAVAQDVGGLAGPRRDGP